MSRRSFLVLIVLLIPLFFFILPHHSFAHEVYVLDSGEINTAMQAPIPDFGTMLGTHYGEFLTWGISGIAFIMLIFFLSINSWIERLIDPLLIELKKIAPFIAQITLGFALAASGYYHAVFGVELPLIGTFGQYAGIMSIVLLVVGAMLVLGIFPRLASMVTVGIFIALITYHGVYMLNYATYLAEALTVALFGGAYTLIKSNEVSAIFSRVIPEHLHDYKFLIIRIFFGVSLVYASLYAKLIHGQLALETVTKYNLTHYFHFDPLFLVLGAMLVEIFLGLCFMLGFEIRFASLFFLTFLTMSVIFFGEAVWPHIILIGTALAMFAHGYDKYTMTKKMYKRNALEPTL